MKRIFNIGEENYDSFSDRDWNRICRYCIVSEEILEKYFDKIDIDIISKYQILSCDFINKFYSQFTKSIFSLSNLLNFQKLDSKLVEKLLFNSDKLSKVYIKIKSDIIIYQEVDEKLIEKYYIKEKRYHSKSYYDSEFWDEIFRYQKLSSDFIKKYKKDLPVDKDIFENLKIKTVEERVKFVKDGITRVYNHYFPCVKSYFYISKDYIITVISVDEDDYYDFFNLKVKLELGKDIKSESIIGFDIFNGYSFYKVSYLVKVNYEDLRNEYIANKITPIAKLNKGWKLKIE